MLLQILREEEEEEEEDIVASDHCNLQQSLASLLDLNSLRMASLLVDLGRRGHRNGSRSPSVMALVLCCALFFSISPLLSMAGSDFGSPRSFLRPQTFASAGRRRLFSGAGPGSFPPLCATKCGGCTPCTPVHVAVPPGRPVIDEYYPEAWRCKCGSKLFMP